MGGSTNTPLIVRLLVEAKRVEEKALSNLAKAMAEHPGRVEEALIRGELAEELDVARTHAESLGIPLLFLEAQQTSAGEDVDEDATEPEANLVESRVDGPSVDRGPLAQVVERCGDIARAVGETACRRHRLVPVGDNGHLVDVACLDPSDFLALEEVRMRCGRIVRPFAAPLSLVASLTALHFGERDEVREIASEAGAVGASAEEDEEDGEAEIIVDLGRAVVPGKDGHVVRIVNMLLKGSIEQGASDIHLEPYEDEVRVRYRVDGKLQAVTPPPKALFIPTISRLKILAKMDIAERRIPQDGAIALKNGEARVDLRVSTVPTVYGEKMVIRLLEKSGIPPALQDLGFTDEQAKNFMDAASSPHGLMFVTGPTGSGKSTTLYCCLNLINVPTQNIVTVEDPVEYKFHGLNQVHVRHAVGLDFSSALRSFLRQDPDVIMVGEVRDQETAGICMRAAMTGHLVLSTLHTNNSLQVINRLSDMGVEPFLLGPALRLIEAQRLARRLCPDCKQPYEIPDDVAERYGIEAGATLYRAGEGSCGTCRDRGYKGRVGLYEVVAITTAIREAIVARVPYSELRQVAANEGVEFLADAARNAASDGRTSLEEVAEFIEEGS